MLNASTKYIHKSHMSAVVYTCTFHRSIHINPKVSQSSSILSFFKEIKFSRQNCKSPISRYFVFNYFMCVYIYLYVIIYL